MKMSKYLILFVTLCIICLGKAENNYCSWSPCVDEHNVAHQHTMCIFNPNGVSEHCGKVLHSGLSNDEIKNILNYHNYYRQRVASGMEIGYNKQTLPRAVNGQMGNLVWNAELAKVAQKWAEQCHNYDSRHDSCRNIGQTVVGQNVGYSWHSIPTAINLDQILQGWYNEVRLVTPEVVKYFHLTEGVMIGHYTQMVWAKTKEIGCGRLRYIDPAESAKHNMDMYAEHLVCNYGPAGNYVTEPIYEFENSPVANNQVNDIKNNGVDYATSSVENNPVNDIKNNQVDYATNGYDDNLGDHAETNQYYLKQILELEKEIYEILKKHWYTPTAIYSQ